MPKFEKFPATIRPYRQKLHLMPSVRTGPVLGDGRQQRVHYAAAHWVCETAYILTQPSDAREFRSYVTKMAGGAAEFIMPIHDRRNAPWPSGYDFESAKPSVSWASGRTWSLAWKRQIIKVRASVAAAAGVNTMEVLQVNAGKIRRGHYFSIVDTTGRARLYQIDTAIQEAMSVDGAVLTISFQPTLRAPVAAKDILDFDDPCCTMTLAAVDGGQVTVEGWAETRAELSLRESFGGV